MTYEIISTACQKIILEASCDQAQLGTEPWSMQRKKLGWYFLQKCCPGLLVCMYQMSAGNKYFICSGQTAHERRRNIYLELKR